MAKLHELLAVESTLSDQAEARRKELITTTFEKKKTHFVKKIVTFQPSDEGKSSVTEEQLGMQTTVPQELRWIGEHVARAIDAAYQIDEANTRARADVIVENGIGADGEACSHKLLENIPATQLLQLQKRVQELKELIIAVPTLDPSKGFVKDPDEGHHVWKAREEVKVRRNKQRVRHVLYDATKEHPAQVQLLEEDVPVGEIHTQEWSGFISSTDKSDMLDRVEAVLRAVKKARARANEEEVDVKNLKFANKILSYVFGEFA